MKQLPLMICTVMIVTACNQQSANQQAPAANQTNVAAPQDEDDRLPPVGIFVSGGKSIGEMKVTKKGNGWGIDLIARNSPLKPGTHGIHLHEVGRCEGPDFASAGAHFNPTGKQHGHDNPAGWHLGDLGNLEVLPNGTFGMGKGVRGTRLEAGDPGTDPVVRDADGAAVVIHAEPDDEKTDPSGNSGDRIACAVIPPTE